MTELTTIFVYGTLKRGCRNHTILESAVFLGATSTEPKYLMYDCGSHPGLVMANPGQIISGELYRVGEALLEAVDSFEDVPNQYLRCPIELRCRRLAEAYFYRWDTREFSVCGSVWDDKER